MTAFPLLPFIAFAIAGSVTPGPNVLMVAAASANSGLRATVPHMLGISVGFAAMILIVGLGLAVPLASFPQIHTGMRWIGAAWIGWIAWQIAVSPLPGAGKPRPPLRFFGAAMFQWINPKAWMLALGMATTWTNPEAELAPQYVAMAVIFALVGLPCSLLWGALGKGAGRILRHPLQLRIFNIAMALLLIGSMIPVLLD
jgi:threonine/homoserine/homoserine lactone efflux protein